MTDNENFEYMTTITIACNESYTVSSRSPDAMTCIQDKSGRMVWQPPYVPRCFRKYFLSLGAGHQQDLLAYSSENFL